MPKQTELARELMDEWLRESLAGESPIDRLGLEWWRESFARTGFFSATVREHVDGEPEFDIRIGVEADPSVWAQGLYRVQGRWEAPKWSWWNDPLWAMQHLFLLGLRNRCVVVAAAPDQVFATITYERVNEAGVVELGSVEVIADAGTWERVEAGEMMERIATGRPIPRVVESTQE